MMPSAASVEMTVVICLGDCFCCCLVEFFVALFVRAVWFCEATLAGDGG
jgi:hypothetical protein